MLKQIAGKVIKKADNILTKSQREKAFAHMMEYSEKRPLDINIETTTICPMKCKFCCNRIYDRQRDVMPVEMFNSIVEKYVSEFGGGTIGISAMQSDFMSDPLLLDRLDVIRKYRDKLWVHSTTPLIAAARFSDEELLEIISNMDFIEVSVEGYDKETYQNMCGVNGFDTLIAQLRRLKRLIDENNLKLSVDVAFRTYDRKGLMASDIYKELTSTFKDGGIIDNFFSWFGSIKVEDLPKGATLHISDNSDKKEDCVVPHATLAVQTNGNVVGCGCIDWLETFVIGNVNKSSLTEIWKSDKAVAFRKLFSSGRKKPHICKECGLYAPVSRFGKKELVSYESMDGLYYQIK